MTRAWGARARLAVVLLAATWAGSGAAQAQAPEGERWVVTGVANDPGMAIAALLDDDPAYLGAELVITAASIAWDAAATNGQGEYDGCPRPLFTGTDGTPGEIVVTCDGTEWGPGATLRTFGARRMELNWYDGGVLTLTKRDAGR